MLIHGLTGCADSDYVLTSARQLLMSEYSVLRLNLRGSAPTRRLCRQFYHAGRSGDFGDALAALDPARGLVRDALPSFSDEWAPAGGVTLVVFRPQASGATARAADAP